MSITSSKNFLKTLLIQVYLHLTYYTQVTRISVSSYFDNTTLQGSIYGGTQLWLKGNGFDYEGLNNKIFVGDIECQIDDYFTQPTQLSCTIPKNIYLDYLSQNLPITVYSKGNLLSCNTNCNFAFYIGNSPYIRAIVPNAVVAGDQIFLKGFHYTRNSDNIKQILIGQGYQCDFTPETDLEDTEGYSIRGWDFNEDVSCKLGDDVMPGDYDVRYAIKERAGFADIFKSARSFDYETGQEYHLRVYPKISSISQNSGYINGSYLTIEGFGFGFNKDDIEVEIDDSTRKMDLQILDVQNDQIKVKVLKDERSAPATPNVVFLGGTGYTHTYTPNSGSAEVTVKLVPENIEGKTYKTDTYVGILKAPVTGEYILKLASDDASYVEYGPVDFTSAFDKDSLTKVCEVTGYVSNFRNFFQKYTYDDPTKCRLNLTQNQHYYIYIYHNQYGGPEHLTVSIEVPDQVRTPPRLNTKPPVSHISITNTYVPEIIEITIMNATGGSFFVQLSKEGQDDKLTPDIPFDADANTFKNAMQNDTNLNNNMTVTKQMLDSAGEVTTVAADQAGSKYILTYYRVRNYTAMPFLHTTNLQGSGITTDVQQVQQNSPPLAGNFKLTIGSDEVEFSYSSDAQAITQKLQKLATVGEDGVSAFRRGDNWSQNDIYIIWDCFANQSISITISEHNITGGNSPNLATITLTQLEAPLNNSLFYYQIPPEFIRTFHSSPQLKVKLKNQYAVCKSNNCDYTTIALTDIPEVSTWSLTDTTLTLTIANDTRASGFTWNSDNIQVRLGNGLCTVTNVSLPTITCTMQTNSDNTPYIEAGTHTPEVYLKGLGFLTSSTTQNYTLTATQISPDSGSLGGNQLITITGTGFSPQAQVTIDSNDCNIQSVNNIQITCKTPANTSAASKQVTITQGSLTNTDLSYTYDLSKTITITALSPSSASPVLKNDLVITGTNFGTDSSLVQIWLYSQSTDANTTKDYLCNIKAIADTEVTCRLSGGYTADYRVKAYNVNNGNSISTGDNNLFKYEITVTDYTPKEASSNGGTIVTITGTNFSTNLKDNLVQVGELDNAHFCHILTATTTQITCQMEPLKNQNLLNQNLNFYLTGKIVEVAKCTSCQFVYKNTITPQVTALSASSFTGGDSITITGTSLKTTNATKIILHNDTLKKELTSLTTHTDTSIVFDAPEIIAGTYTINVLVEDLGYATFDSVSQDVQYQLKLTSVSPNSGSKGGQEITLNGHGFSDQVQVQIGSSSCTNIELKDTTEISCRVPIITTTGQLNVVVTQASLTDTLTNGYTVNDTVGTVTNMTPKSFTDSDNIQINLTVDSTLSTLGGTIKPILRNLQDYSMTIEGQAFDFNGSASVVFTNVHMGLFQLELYHSTNGYAYINPTGNEISIDLSGQTLTYTNQVSSYMGGQELQINGKGFPDNPNKDIVNATLCNQPAQVKSSSYNQLVVITPAIVTPQVADEYSIQANQKITADSISIVNGSSKADLQDGSYYTSTGGSDCEIVLDHGENYQVLIDSIRMFPKLNLETDSVGDTIKGSNDGTTYTLLHTLEDNLIENWNTFKVPAGQNWNYRYIKYTAKKCQLAEMYVYGQKVFTNFTTNLTSNKCDLKITQDSIELTDTQVVEYRQDATPKVTALSPKTGPTNGNTTLTISGTNFSPDNCTVKIDDVSCSIQSVSATTISCITQARSTYTPSTLQVNCTNGYAATQSHKFLYIDRWSDSNTWGGELPPVEGESVFVPKGQTLLVDISPPKLKLVTVEGTLIFEDEKDLTFDAHYIVIREGHLIAGLPDQRHQHKLTITLHGIKEDQALPSMGNKLIGNVRGKLDLHGKFIQHTWSTLANTAQPGDTTITVLNSIDDWEVGSQIVIASSTRNQSEFEERQIVSISNKTITLNQPLQYKHYAATETYNGVDYELRTEVGLLSRNVKVQGDESTKQTRHGVHIMMTGKDDSVQGRFSYIEVAQAGQVFHMGRYPIHFHMTGNCIDSYLEGVAIHHAFNRCTTFHGVHYLTIKKGVYYKNLGHCIFVEDSIESRNVVEDTLVMRTNISSSLLMSDLKAAQFWITRPLNYFMRNHAVGSQKFGFWYDLPSHPTGPSSTDTICPVGERLGKFEDNVSHGHGIGLRIYPQYKPLTNPCGPLRNTMKKNIFEDNLPLKPVFKNLLTYGNGIGFFGRNVGAIVLENFANISNSNSFTFMEPEFEIYDYYPLVTNSIVVDESGYTTAMGPSTNLFLSSSKKHGVKIQNVKLINFNNKTFMTACHSCDPISPKNHLGMVPTHFKNLTFENSTFNKYIKFNAPLYVGKDLIYDEDGSLFTKMGLTGISTGFITPYFKHLEISQCQHLTDTSLCSVDCLFCPDSVLIERLEIKRTKNLMKGMDLKVFDMTTRNDFSNTIEEDTNFGIIKHMDYPKDNFQGWVVPVIINHQYNFFWNTGYVFENIQIQNNVQWEDDKSIIARFNVTNAMELYDIKYTGFNQADEYVTNVLLPHSTSNLQSSEIFGESNYDQQTGDLKINIGETRGKITVQQIVCRDNCPEEEPEQPQEDTFRYWSKSADWGEQNIPQEGSSPVIEASWKMIVDVEVIPTLTQLLIKGTLIFQDSTAIDTYQLNSKIIHVTRTGKLLIGSSSVPFTKPLTINLHGGQLDDRFVVASTINPSNKLLVVGGQVEIHAQQRAHTQTKLKQSATFGNNVIVVKDNVDWKIGDFIAISSTSQHWNKDEKHEIISITNNNITLKNPLQFNHYGTTQFVSTKLGSVDMSAEVILLTRNVKIQGIGSVDWGCHINVVGYQGVDEDRNIVQVEGQIIFDSVQISNCGQKDTDFAALQFTSLKDTTKKNFLKNSSIEDSLNWSVHIHDSNGIEMQNNVIYNSLKYGVYMKDPQDIIFEQNNVMKIRNRTWYENLQDLDIIIGFYIDDGNIDLIEKNVIIRNNIISGSEWFAWAVPGYSCGSTNNNFHDNTGHSSRAGWFGTMKYSTCQRYSKFTAYRNYEEGFVNRFMIHELRVDQFILIDNNNAIAVNGGSSSGKEFPKSSIKNSVIIGKALTDCSFCYDNELDCDTNGIYTSLFEKENYKLKFNEYYLPLHNSTFSNYLWGGKQEISSVDFKNFNDNTFCNEEKAFVIRANNFVQDTSVYVTMKDNSLENVDHLNKFFFANHTRLKHPAFCSMRDCTGIYNLIVDDVTGDFDLADKPFQYFGFNKPAGQDGNCTFVEEWNGHQCLHNYSLISGKKTFNDRSPIITPLYLNEYLKAADLPVDQLYKNTVDNENEIPAIVKDKGYIKLEFSQSMPSGNYYKLDNSNVNTYTVFKATSRDPATLMTKVNGVMLDPEVLPVDGVINWSSLQNKCGAYIFYPKLQTIEWIMNAQSNCVVHIIQIKSIKASVRLNIPVKDFYNNNGVTQFIDNLSALLSIHPSQIKIVGIQEGSSIVNFVILSNNPTADESTTSDQQLAQIEELDNINEKLKTDINQLTVDGAEVLDYSSELQVTEASKQEYNTKCRFYNENEVYYVDGYVEDYQLRKTNSDMKFFDLQCSDCNVQQCKAKISEVCKVTEGIISDAVCNPPIDQNPNQDSSAGLVRLAIMVLFAMFI